MGEIDAAGELVTGGLLARAVDRQRGGGDPDPHGPCLNCGTALVGPHCHRCGQAAHVHRSIGGIWHDLLHGVVHFEGRLWNTLPLLVFRPGQLTRRYVHGERAHFVSPMAMFLFSVFTMFAMLQIMGVSPPADLRIPGEYSQDIERARERTQAELATVRAQRARAQPGSAAEARLDARIADLSDDLAGLDRIAPPSDANLKFQTGWKRLDKGVAKAVANPGLALYKLQTNSYKFSWALIPLSIPFLWLIFAWKRQYKGYDHAVFVTYSLAFMSLLFIALTVGGAIGLGQGAIGTIAMLAPPAHIFFQLRDAYRLRWWSAALRTVVLLFLIGFILLLFGLLLLGLGLLG